LTDADVEFDARFQSRVSRISFDYKAKYGVHYFTVLIETGAHDEAMIVKKAGMRVVSEMYLLAEADYPLAEANYDL